MILRLGMVALFGVLLQAQQKEAALGAGVASDVGKRTTEITDAAVQGYVERLGRQVAGAGIDWKFTVVSDRLGGSTDEPLSLPGGYIFVSASLILAAQNEAEMAGMLAHSFVHIAEGHWRQTPTGGWMGAINENDSASLPLAVLRARQSSELDADRGAAKLLAAAGHDSGALLDYLRRTQGASRELRIRALEEALGDQPVRARVPSVEFTAIQSRVRELTTASSQRVKQPTLRRPAER